MPEVSVSQVDDAWLDVGIGLLIPLQRRSTGAVTGLPDPQPDTLLIVSSMVLDAAKGRVDLIAPDTGATAIRDDAGRIVAVTRFVR